MKQIDTDRTSHRPAIRRRTVVRGVGTLAVAGVLGTGATAARHQDSGPQEKCGCIDDADAWGKYDFVIEKDEDGNVLDCYFEHTEGEDLVTITDWDDKENEECEPIVVYYEPAVGYQVSYVCAFGGDDNHDDPDPEDGTYVSDLVNPGGRQAAISNLVFCLAEVESSFVGYQVDLIHGDDLIEDLSERTYGGEQRLLQARWSDPDDPEGRLEPGHFDHNTDKYQHCIDSGLEITQDITFDDEGTATACIDPGAECNVSDFSLVSYRAQGHNWNDIDPAEQELWDYDLIGDPDTGCFTVELPPTE